MTNANSQLLFYIILFMKLTNQFFFARNYVKAKFYLYTLSKKKHLLSFLNVKQCADHFCGITFLRKLCQN